MNEDNINFFHQMNAIDEIAEKYQKNIDKIIDERKENIDKIIEKHQKNIDKIIEEYRKTQHRIAFEVCAATFALNLLINLLIQ